MGDPAYSTYAPNSLLNTLMNPLIVNMKWLKKYSTYSSL